VGRIESEVRVDETFQKIAYLVGRLGSGSRLVAVMGRIGSRVPVSVSLPRGSDTRIDD